MAEQTPELTRVVAVVEANLFAHVTTADLTTVGDPRQDLGVLFVSKFVTTTGDFVGFVDFPDFFAALFAIGLPTFGTPTVKVVPVFFNFAAVAYLGLHNKKELRPYDRNPEEK